MIRNATPADAAAISAIYNHYVLNTTVTFEETEVSPAHMAARITDVQATYPWLVYETDGKIIGYAFAGTWKARAAYRHTTETSIYLLPGYTGKGIGRQLYAALIDKLKAMNIHLLIGGIALPNEACIALHESLGFTQTAQFGEVGQKFGNWIDVGYWQLNLDARATSVKDYAFQEQYY